MRYVGMDIHKQVIQAVSIDANGQRLETHRFGSTPEAIDSFMQEHLCADDAVVVENTTNTWAIVGLLEGHVAEVVVSNPLRTRAIAEAKIKTDKVDAETLAQLLRSGFLPRVWRPDAETQKLRQLMRRRASIVGDRTSIKNRIHAVLHRRLIHPPVKSLFSKSGMEWLRQVTLDELSRDEIDAALRLLESVDAEIAHVENVLAKIAYESTGAKLLITLPGVDVIVAVSVLAALGDVARFPSGDHAASYLGLVPTVRLSAGRGHHGGITKQGRTLTRWMLVQAAQHAAKHPGPLGAFFRKVQERKGRNVAVVATARKLATIAWYMLKNGEPYRYATPTTTSAKLAKLRVKATGKRRRTGPAKGTPRAAAYGSGRGTRAVPSLDEVYAGEGLPARAPLTEGERRAVSASGADQHLETIASSHRVARGAKQEEQSDSDHGATDSAS